jgi:hypothetical protein
MIMVLLLFNSCSKIEEGNTLPNLKEWSYSRIVSMDVVPQIPGAETSVEIYQRTKAGKLENLMIFKLPNDKIYAYAIRDQISKNGLMFWDSENDGIFEQEGLLGKMQTGKINLEIYGYEEYNIKD